MAKRVRWPQKTKRPRPTVDCGEHKAYRSEHEAVSASKWHPVTACTRCLGGKVWHVWRHDDHWHVGHSSLWAMARS